MIEAAVNKSVGVFFFQETIFVFRAWDLWVQLMLWIGFWPV